MENNQYVLSDGNGFARAENPHPGFINGHSSKLVDGEPTWDDLHPPLQILNPDNTPYLVKGRVRVEKVWQTVYHKDGKVAWNDISYELSEDDKLSKAYRSIYRVIPEAKEAESPANVKPSIEEMAEKCKKYFHELADAGYPIKGDEAGFWIDGYKANTEAAELREKMLGLIEGMNFINPQSNFEHERNRILTDLANKIKNEKI